MMDKTLKFTITLFLLISAVLVVVAVQAVRNIDRTTRDNDWVNHTHAVITQIDTLSTTLYISEATAKAYVADGISDNLAACNQALAHLSEHTQLLTDLTRYETDQQPLIVEIRALTENYIQSLQSIMGVREEGQINPARTQFTKLLSGPKYAEL